MGHRSTKSISGITSQRPWPSFPDAHPSHSEETSTETPFQAMRRLAGTTPARRSRTTERTSAKYARRSSGTRPRGLRGRCRQIRAGKETWRGHNGVQSRPDHILLSVDLASPRVTVDFQSPQTLKGTALAPIDHAPLRITLQYRFPSQGPAAQSEAPGQSEICGDDDGPALCEAFRRGGGDMSTGELEQITTTGPGDTPRPKLAKPKKFHSESGFDDTPCRRLAKRGGHGSARTQWN